VERDRSREGGKIENEEVKVNLSICLIKHYAMKMDGGVDV
jgi:hypothetical protein